MTQVSRKGFRDKNGKQVVIVPPKEEYAGDDIFQDSDAIDTILSEGVHHILYKKDGKKYPTQHILVVHRDYEKTYPIAPNREIVHQLLIDDFGGIMKRYRKFTDTELLEPDGDWTEWVSMIPTIDIDSTITEDGVNPVTGAAIYAALAGKADSIKTLRLSHNTYSDEFLPPSSSDRELISAFMDDVPENQLVPVVVKLFEGLHEDGEVIGVAKWYTSEDQQNEFVNIEVTIGNILFRATDTDVSSIDEWVRTPVGQSFFTISNS